jgi:hypothetical protein
MTPTLESKIPESLTDFERFAEINNNVCRGIIRKAGLAIPGIAMCLYYGLTSSGENPMELDIIRNRCAALAALIPLTVSGLQSAFGVAIIQYKAHKAGLNSEFKEWYNCK